MINAQRVYENLTKIQSTNPVIHNITNYVVMEQTANALLAIGASPIMAHATQELHDILKISNALVLNIGTLDAAWVNRMEFALMASQSCKLPIILDPVGAGASSFRTRSALGLCNTVTPHVIRGNAAEIIALSGAAIHSKGVDSQYATDAALDAAQRLSAHYQCIVAVSGATDLVVHDNKIYALQNGNPLMTKVTGMGCTATALIGAFCAVNSDYLQATCAALSVMGICGEVAAQDAEGPGSFYINFLDNLYCLNEETIQNHLKVSTQYPARV